MPSDSLFGAPVLRHGTTGLLLLSLFWVGCTAPSERRPSHPREAVSRKQEPAIEPAQAAQESSCDEDCWAEGRCTLVEGACRAVEEGHCLASFACRNGGRCSLRNGVCKKLDDADCAASPECLEHGRCAAFAGECWAKGQTREDCAAPRGSAVSNHCKEKGRCTPLLGGFCMVGSMDDCKQSDICKQHGACSVFTGWTEDEVALLFCGAHGRDCERSEDCKRGGRCISWAGSCVESCDENAACANGYCRVVDGECAQ